MRVDGWLSGPEYQARSKYIGNEICRNLYMEFANQPPHGHARGKISLITFPGFADKWDLGSTKVRGIIPVLDRLFAVVGTTLWELFSDYTSTNRGTVSNDGNPVSMSTNRFELFIVSGSDCYNYTLATDVLATVAGLSLDKIVFADGYFAGLTPDSQIFRISGQYDGTTWNAADFTSAEGDPDNLVTIEAFNRNIWCFGTKSIEVFYDSGNADFPYERIPGALLEEGCAAARSVIIIDNAPFWLGRNEHGEGMFFRANGYNPQRISDHGVEYQLSTYSTLADCISWGARIAGHSFIVWTFPTDNKTQLYDVSNGMFTELSEWIPATSTWNRFRAENHAFMWGKHFIGDHSNGKIYELDEAYKDYDGGYRRWLRACPIPNTQNVTVYPSDLELLCEVGKGLAGGAATITMRYSKDGGHTFGNERTATLGSVGNYGHRVRWPGHLGSARYPFVELSGTDAIDLVLTDAVVNIEMGTH